jgi:hypothetical protein
MENIGKNSKKTGKIQKKSKLNSDKILKISWNVKWYGKYRRKLWNDTENMEEKKVE